MAVIAGTAQPHTPYRCVTLIRSTNELAFARLHVKHFLVSRHIGNQNTFDWAIIGVSELVGNAIKHTRSPKFRLFMWPPDRIGPMFGVWDDELTLPRIPTATPPNPHDLRESGYGLPSIRNFSHAMGAQFFAPEKNPGKLVWFQLDTRSAQWTDPDPRNGLAQNKGG